jgi:protocatechuate 3,4-dioxygenase beta subunit
MHDDVLKPTRRAFLGRLGAGAAFFAVPGLFAEALAQTTGLRRTAEMTEGPFYPDALPLDTDNDLLILNDATTPAVGEVTHLTGRISTRSSEPVGSAFVEIWQVDATASYIHSNGRQPGGHDGNFQGYGRFLTDTAGRYYFRTIKPVSYSLGGTFRAPHIHFAINKNGRRILTTQLHVRGHEDNARDPLLSRIRSAEERDTVLGDFLPLEGSRIGELKADFDIVLGETLEEVGDGDPLGGLARPQRRGFGRGFGPGRRR